MAQANIGVLIKSILQDKAKEMIDRAQLADPKLVEELKKEIEKQKK